MRIVIIGAVAAGTSAAAKARRNNEAADIVIYEKDHYISYSGCSMPYYIGGVIGDLSELTPRDPAFFKNRYNVDIFALHEVLSIHPEEMKVTIKDLATNEIFIDYYDQLVLSTGAIPVIPDIKGIDLEHVFVLRNIYDMIKIKSFAEQYHPHSIVIAGSGFIGLEMCENFKKLGFTITLIEKQSQVTPGFDSDMAVYLEEHLKTNEITVITGVFIIEIKEKSVILSDGRIISADLVLLSTGIQPNIRLAKDAGIELGITGAIKVNRKMETSINNIFACGDCIELLYSLTGKPIYRPLGSTANKTGRIAGDSITNGNLEFRGVLGTGIFKVFDMTAAQTGLTEREALDLGYDVAVCHNIKPDKPVYMGGKEMVIKGVADKVTGRLLGVQIIGYEGVDKRIDVFVTAITFKAKVEDLFHLDLAYAPPFSTTKDPVMYTGMILDNAIHNDRPLLTAQALDKLIDSEL
ncbi:MAG: NAD(FAD)-dependent dehydrogenase [Anaerocolumna sp.]|jgi:NADPH-dependent 2,4-dienoyl-CoA reductase/sulfur reductase-like enzyme|nr:NAD(FAD)-dependent dehydrogenase [Anaerocolumna sp.]